MLQFQKGDKLAVMKSTDSTIINRYFDVAGVEVTQGYAFKRLRLGGAQSAREAGVFSEEVKKQMSHASSAHKRNYLKQLPKTMKDMVAGAGHSQQTILLGRSAVSARHTKEFQDLYWSVCPTKDPGFRARVQLLEVRAGILSDAHGGLSGGHGRGATAGPGSEVDIRGCPGGKVLLG